MFRIGNNTKEIEPTGKTNQTSQPTPHNQSSAYDQAPPTNGASTALAVSDSESLARDIKEGSLGGFVGRDAVLIGETIFKGILRVDGHVSGKISSQDGRLVVSTNGVIDATIEVAVAQIQGTVNGDVTASKSVEIGRVGKVNGNLYTPALLIEQGAVFEGSCRMTKSSN